jgi:hypothetical protein
MAIITYKDNGISDKFCKTMKTENFLSELSKIKNIKLIKTASNNANITDFLQIFAKALSDMNLKTEIDLGELLKRIMFWQSTSIEKNAAKKDKSREETIKIASKEVKDSHYHIDVSKDSIEKSGIKLHMASVYARDAYLGRYLIKRNFYYLDDNENSADETFDELTNKIRKIKAKYHGDQCTVNGILTDVKNILTGVVSDKFTSFCT